MNQVITNGTNYALDVPEATCYGNKLEPQSWTRSSEALRKQETALHTMLKEYQAAVRDQRQQLETTIREQEAKIKGLKTQLNDLRADEPVVKRQRFEVDDRTFKLLTSGENSGKYQEIHERKVSCDGKFTRSGMFWLNLKWD